MTPANHHTVVSCYRAAQRGSNREHIIKLKELARFLEKSIAESKRAQTQHDLYRLGELTARTTKTICDLIISGFASTPATRAFAEIYDVSQIIVDAANQNLGPKSAIDYSNSKKLTAIKHHLGKGHKATKIINTLEDIYKIGGEIYEFSKGQGGASGIESSRRTAEKQLSSLRQKIFKLENELILCDDIFSNVA